MSTSTLQVVQDNFQAFILFGMALGVGFTASLFAVGTAFNLVGECLYYWLKPHIYEE